MAYKKIILVFLAMILALSFAGCKDEGIESKNKEQAEVAKENAKLPPLEIKERYFITQINDIYLNIKDFKNRKIVIEGIFDYFPTADQKRKLPVVYRFGPGCCTNDTWGGFMLDYDKPFPKKNAWIEVKGTPYIEKDGDYKNLFLKVTSLRKKSPRGSERVTN